jgi:hypothetical protein
VQARICPACHDDHFEGRGCTPEDNSEFRAPDTDQSFIAIEYRKRVAERDAALKERDEANERADNAEARGIHTCNPNCKRPGCVLRRERDAALARAEAAEKLLAEKNHQVSGLFDAIAHGDDAHRAWLKEAIREHFCSQCNPAPPGQTRAEGPKTRPDGQGETT